MKKYRIASTILICLLSLSLFSCVNSGYGEDLPFEGNVEIENTGKTEDTDNTDDTSTDTENADTPSFQILTDPAIPSEEDIMRVFKHAASVWDETHIGTLDAIGENEPGTPSVAVMYEGGQYYPVRDYKTKADLEARFRECFSNELTKQTIEYHLGWLYREIDGRLYVTPADRGTDIRAGAAKVEYEVISDTEIKVTRLINVRECAFVDGYDDRWYCAGVNPQEMMLIYEEGRWVFDNFFVCDDLSAYDNGEAVYYEYAENIAEAFIIAEELAAHFTGHTHSYIGDDSFDAVDENGFTQKYTYYGLADSLAELRALLNEVFTPELAEDFMSTEVSGLPLFTERDGKLYKFGGYVGLYSFGNVSREIEGYTDNGDGTVSVTVSINVYGTHTLGKEVHTTHTYTAVLGDDSKYRFSGEFELPIQIAVRLASNE